MSGKGTPPAPRRVVHCMEWPITCLSAFSGAQASFQRERSSRPYMVAHPASRDITPSPVASTNHLARWRMALAVSVLREITAVMRPAMLVSTA